MRHRGEPPSVKCNHVSARSMEILRRMGVASKLRDTGLPADYPNDISYRVSFTGKELSRIPIPCRRDRYVARGGPYADWPTPEPPHRINQIFLEDPREAEVRSRFLRYQNRVEYETHTFVGKRTDLLRMTDDGFKIARREIILDQNILLAKNLTAFF